jgi:isopentenyl-diphosphate delta-isomerase
MDADRVILVDPGDREVGTAPKLDAHHAGALHRAFSVFVFDSRGDLLLQRRARSKYHSGGLWTNTCCGHPQPGEDTERAARRRLREEMGFTCPLTAVGSFTYRAEVGGRLLEHELDHVYVGVHDGVPLPSPAEVDAWRRRPVSVVQAALERDPGQFTAWFAPALAMALGAGVPPLPAALLPGRTVPDATVSQEVP